MALEREMADTHEGRTEGVDPQKAAVARYKEYLSGIVDLRPSGMRQMIAVALDKNRSFVTQMISADYPMGIPARHVPVIIEVCRFSDHERERFLKLYVAAHPDRTEEVREHHHPSNELRTIRINVPAVEDVALAAEIEIAVQKVALEIAAAMVRAASACRPVQTKRKR